MGSLIERIAQGQAHAPAGIGRRQNVNIGGLGEQSHHGEVLPLRTLLRLHGY